MAISILFLILCDLVLLFWLTRSRYGLPMFFLISGVVLATVSILFQYYSSSSYVPPSWLPFRGLDILLYRMAGRSIRFSMAQMQTIRNIGVITYLLGIAAFTHVLRGNLMTGGSDAETRKQPVRTIALIAVTVILAVSYLVFYSTDTAYAAYLAGHRLAEPGRTGLVRAFSGIHALFSVLIALYMFYPLAFLLVNLVRKRVTCFTDTAVIIFSSLPLINCFFYFFLFLGIFRNRVEHVFSSGFWFYNRITRIPALYIGLYPLVALTILLFTVLSANVFFSQDLISYARKRVRRKQIDDLNYNLKDVFHSEKNLMFSINILANEIRADYGSDEARRKLDRLIELSGEQMKSLSESLNAIKHLHMKPGAVDIKALTDAVIDQVQIPREIRVERHYCTAPAHCIVDPYHTRQALSNLILNSIDSLSILTPGQGGEKTGGLSAPGKSREEALPPATEEPDTIRGVFCRAAGSATDRCKSDTKEHFIEEKKLIVTIDASKEWIYWSLFDNGVGIDRSEVRKYMMPFVSTKSKNANWGIGLPYALRVVNAQLGKLRMTGSTRPERHYALVEILLPRRKKENGEDKASHR